MSQRAKILSPSLPVFEHKLLYLLTISIAANLDNLGVGIAYGLAKTQISTLPNLLIAIISGIFTYLAMALGILVGMMLPPVIANTLGATLLILVGFWVGWEHTVAKLRHQFSLFVKQVLRILEIRLLALRGKRKQTEPTYKTNSKQQKRWRFKTRCWRQIAILGLSLSLNAIAGGFAASLAGHNSAIDTIAIPIGVASFSYLTIAVGQRVSARLVTRWLGDLSQKIAALLLIGIGVSEFYYG